MPRYRAWHFNFPGAHLPAGSIGISFSPQGGIEMVEEAEAIRQSVLLLIATSPGERVMRPEYGCDLARLIFSPNDDTTAGLAIHYIRRAIERWETRIEITKIDANRNSLKADQLDIELNYRLRITRQMQQLNLSIGLTSGVIA